MVGRNTTYTTSERSQRKKTVNDQETKLKPQSQNPHLTRTNKKNKNQRQYLTRSPIGNRICNPDRRNSQSNKKVI